MSSLDSLAYRTQKDGWLWQNLTFISSLQCFLDDATFVRRPLISLGRAPWNRILQIDLCARISADVKY
jgi:hypothetical protein